MGLPAYATVEQVARAADVQFTAYQKQTLQRVTRSASRLIDERMHRRFFPKTELRTFKNPQIEIPYRVATSGFFVNADLQTITAATVDTVAQTVADIELYPVEYGPPYSWVGLTGVDITVTGTWTFSADTEPAGALSGAMSDTTGTAPKVSNSAIVGIGDLILVDSEQLLVLDKLMVDSGVDTTTTLAADMSDVTVAVADGTLFFVGEVLLLGAERMLIVDVATNNLIVKRAFDGTVLAAHSTPSIFAPRTLTVERGAVGTTAATHSDAATFTRNVPPPPITQLCIAEALNTLEQESSAYARTVGSGDNQRESRGRSLYLAQQEADRYKRLRVLATR
jgi:hypothetical protein